MTTTVLTHNEAASANLDLSLTKLADILRKLGVEEFNLADDQQYHVVDHDVNVPAQSIDAFTKSVDELYSALVQA